MSLSDIELCHGSRFSVPCRIRHPIQRTAANGTDYLSFMIEDCNMALKAYAWPDHCLISAKVHDLDKVSVSGTIREFNNNYLANVLSIKSLDDKAGDALQLLPRSMCPQASNIDRLQEIVARVSNVTLQAFIEGVFNDDDFAIPFISLPASRRHHHSIAGGLLEHSLECAEMVWRFEEFGHEIRDLAVVGALFHDAGKTMTLRCTDRFSPENCVLDHDALTLEVLAPHLKKLDSSNRDMATALRYLWTWKNHRKGSIHPVLTVAEAISASDRISSALNIEETSFKECPDWHRIVRHKSGNSLFWRPRFAKLH